MRKLVILNQQLPQENLRTVYISKIFTAISLSAHIHSQRFLRLHFFLLSLTNLLFTHMHAQAATHTHINTYFITYFKIILNIINNFVFLPSCCSQLVSNICCCGLRSSLALLCLVHILHYITLRKFAFTHVITNYSLKLQIQLLVL